MSLFPHLRSLKRHSIRNLTPEDSVNNTLTLHFLLFDHGGTQSNMSPPPFSTMHFHIGTPTAMTTPLHAQPTSTMAPHRAAWSLYISNSPPQAASPPQPAFQHARNASHDSGYHGLSPPPHLPHSHDHQDHPFFHHDHNPIPTPPPTPALSPAPLSLQPATRGVNGGAGGDPKPEVYIPLVGAVAPAELHRWEAAGYRVKYFWKGRVPLVLEGEGEGEGEKGFPRYIDFDGSGEAPQVPAVPSTAEGEGARRRMGLFGANERWVPDPRGHWGESRLDPSAREFAPPVGWWRAMTGGGVRDGGDAGWEQPWEGYAGGAWRDGGLRQRGLGRGVSEWLKNRPARQ